MRKLVYSLLSADGDLNLYGITGASIIAEQSVDTPKARPFMILRWGVNLPGASSNGTTVRTLTVHVHDEPADYSIIDNIIKRVKTVLGNAVAMQEAGGGWLTQADWTGDSEDLADDGYGTITRNTSFRVVGSAQ